MKQENASFGDTVKSVGTRVYCKKCQKETAFFRHKCLECGTMFVRAYKGKNSAWKVGPSLDLGQRTAAVREARVNYWKQKAEESRKKFEGK